MQIKEFFLLIGKSVTPGTYKDLTSASMKQACLYFMGVVSLAFFITMLLYVPVFADLSYNFNKGLSKFTKLSIDVSLETSEPISLKNLGVAIDTTGNLTNISEENVLITGKHIMMRPVNCMLFRPLCFLSKDRVRTVSLGSENLMEHRKGLISIATTLVILLIPTIIVSLYLMYLIKYVSIILIASALAFLVTRIRLYEVKLLKTIKLAAYTITPMIFIELINLRFGFNLYFMPLALFAVLFTIGIALIGEKSIKHKGE